MNKTAIETIRKFSTMTNAEAYVEVFHNRLMRPLPDSDVTGEYWGNASRADFYPHLREALGKLSSKGPIRVLDVGAGSGEMVDHVLKHFPVAISTIEPNPRMLHNYLEALKRNAMMAESMYEGTVQSLYEGQPGHTWLKKVPAFNFVLASHMIYGLTSAASTGELDPERDLRQFLAAVYEKLADDGIMFIVYAVGENTILGEAAAYCLSHISASHENNVRKIWKARTHLLEFQNVQEHLNVLFPNYRCEVSTTRVNSLVYGDNLDDIASYCILGELTRIDEEPFDISKLQHIYDFIEKSGGRFAPKPVVGGLRDGMVSIETPQVICTLTKRRRTTN